MDNDVKFMKLAIELSKQAVKHGNEPFGAVMTKHGEIVAINENSIYTSNDPTAHAEMGLLQKFVNDGKVTDLKEYTLYSSCEPCYMCAGAMIWLKLGRLVYGASDRDLARLIGETGSDCVDSVFSSYPTHPEVTSGILRDEAIEVLKSYFSDNIKG